MFYILWALAPGIVPGIALADCQRKSVVGTNRTVRILLTINDGRKFQ